MAITIDGDNLLIILESGVATVDVEKDLYSRWKDWFKTGTNARHLIAFESEGGAPVIGALEQGAYIRFRNDLGWRIRPAEEDATISFTGNLVPADGGLPMLTPTVGGYTVLINGLQPITQNVDGIATLVWERTLEGSLSMEQAYRIMLSVLAGKAAATQSPNQVVYRDVADTKDRVTILHSDDGDRTSSTLDGT